MYDLGIKTKKIKQGNKLPQDVVKMIREKKHLLHMVKGGSDTQRDRQIKMKLKEIQYKIQNGISSYKLQKRKKLRCKQLKEDPSRKRFWRFLRQQIKSAGSISAMIYNKEMVFDQDRIEDAVIEHFEKVFGGQKTPFQAEETDGQENFVEGSLNGPDCCDPLKYENEICTPYTMDELDEILDSLPNCKAAGIDNIPNELLKNTSVSFRMYLITFLNRILEKGEVPEELNVGKCMLVFKV